MGLNLADGFPEIWQFVQCYKLLGFPELPPSAFQRAA